MQYMDTYERLAAATPTVGDAKRLVDAVRGGLPLVVEIRDTARARGDLITEVTANRLIASQYEQIEMAETLYLRRQREAGIPESERKL